VRHPCSRAPQTSTSSVRSGIAERSRPWIIPGSKGLGNATRPNAECGARNAECGLQIAESQVFHPPSSILHPRCHRTLVSWR